MNALVRLCFLLVGMAFGNAYAAVLVADGSGKLTGATNVVVGTGHYNVEFEDGTCDALFSNCSLFTFTTEAEAALASQALLDQVFLDVALGQFDSNPALTRGCSQPGECTVWTPYATISTRVRTRIARNNSSESSDEVDPRIFTNGRSNDTSSDPSTGPFITYAVWSNQVDEPGTLAIAALGAMALALTRRRPRSDQHSRPVRAP